MRIHACYMSDRTHLVSSCPVTPSRQLLDNEGDSKQQQQQVSSLSSAKTTTSTATPANTLKSTSSVRPDSAEVSIHFTIINDHCHFQDVAVHNC
jgi:hypothetical protein